eukprot:s984_g7.t1
MESTCQEDSDLGGPGRAAANADVVGDYDFTHYRKVRWEAVSSHTVKRCCSYHWRSENRWLDRVRHRKAKAPRSTLADLQLIAHLDEIEEVLQLSDRVEECRCHMAVESDLCIVTEGENRLSRELGPLRSFDFGTRLLLLVASHAL